MLKLHAINLLNNKLWIQIHESNDTSKVRKLLKKNPTSVILNQELFEELKHEVKKVQKERLNNSLLFEVKELNHGDICNEIECRLGIYNPVTGDFLTSEITDNTTFNVEFDETEKSYLKVIINKKPI